MKLLLCSVVFAFLISPAGIYCQKSTLPPSGSSTGDPFQIQTGTSFSASSPNSTGTVRTVGSATRNRIINELAEARALISSNYIDSSRTASPLLFENALTSMLHVLDPHSNFYNASEWNDLLAEQHSGYAGIGISISEFTIDGRPATYVVSTFPGTSARQAGLKFGDRIIAVNGQLMARLNIDIVRDKIRGAAGTTLNLTVEEAENKTLRTVRVRRAIVPQPSIADSYIVSPRVGYIDLTEGFTLTTSAEFKTALRELNRAGMTSLIVDLRGNGGGLVDQAVAVAEQFLPAGTTIVSQRGRTPDDNRKWKSSNPRPEKVPLILLVDKNTASASEIVAGAMQDRDRALIVGEKTFGKGLVQNIIDLPYKTGLTLTAARYYTPSGRSIQRDYSDSGRYDYFFHKEQASAIGTTHFETRTPSNRKLFGGDGITPDVLAKTETTSQRQLDLLDPIFFFSLELIGGRIGGIKGAQSADNGQISDLILNKFAEYAVSTHFPDVDLAAINAEQDFIRNNLDWVSSMSRTNSTFARRTLIINDKLVRTAIDSLDKAAALEKLASRSK